jgi:hypothetical protein
MLALFGIIKAKEHMMELLMDINILNANQIKKAVL